MRMLTVSKNEAGQRLDKLLFKYMNLAGKSFVYKMLRKKNITLNGKKCDGSERLLEGDEIRLFLSEETIEKFSEVRVQKVSRVKLEIVYEDEDVIFINKPAGMLSQKARDGDESLVEYLITYLMESGQLTKEELKSFRMLISVSGVGPKAGLAILSACTPSQFALAVATGDSKAFTKIKGIGTKIAQRIVLELKDKVAKENTISVRGNAAQGFAAVPSGAVEEAVTALVVLGYTEGEAMSVISKLDPNLSVEELIKKALIGLAKF